MGSSWMNVGRLEVDRVPWGSERFHIPVYLPKSRHRSEIGLKPGCRSRRGWPRGLWDSESLVDVDGQGDRSAVAADGDLNLAFALQTIQKLHSSGDVVEGNTVDGFNDVAVFHS